jgi:hypothetical protein
VQGQGLALDFSEKKLWRESYGCEVAANLSKTWQRPCHCVS